MKNLTLNEYKAKKNVTNKHLANKAKYWTISFF